MARQSPLSMGFSKQEYWSGLPFPTRGDFPNPEIEPVSLASPALAGRFFTSVPPGKPTIRDGAGGKMQPEVVTLKLREEKSKELV